MTRRLLFNSYCTELYGRALLLSLDCSILPLICTLYCWVLSKAVSSTIFKVFGMTRPKIEPRSPGQLANTLPTWPVSRLRIPNSLFCSYWILSSKNSMERGIRWMFLCKRVRLSSPRKRRKNSSALGVTFDWIWWCVSISGDLRNVDDSFRAITHWLTITRSGSTCLGSIYELNRSF